MPCINRTRRGLLVGCLYHDMGLIAGFLLPLVPRDSPVLMSPLLGQPSGIAAECHSN